MAGRAWLAGAAVALAIATGRLAPVSDEPPSTVGSTYEAAQQQLVTWWRDVDIRLFPTAPPASADQTLLTVRTQRLTNPGWSLKPGTRPIVQLGLVTAMPDLVGRPLGEARKELVARGLSTVWVPLEATDDWVVTTQSYEPGTSVPVYVPTPEVRSRTCTRPPCILPEVTLQVAPAPVTVPPLVGQTETQARETLDKLGLIFVLALNRDGTVPGRVIGQDPAAGTPVVRGSRIVVQVERAPAVLVPDLAGLTEAAAQHVVESVGLVATMDIVRTRQGKGKVVGQDPAAGTQVARGSVVTVRIERSRPVIPAALVAAGGALLVVVLLAVALTLRRRGRAPRPVQQVRARPYFPPPQVRVEQVGPGASHVVSLRPRDDPGSQVVEEVVS